MESKKLEKPCENATFQALQGVMKPDEETGGVFPTMKPWARQRERRPRRPPAGAESAAAGTAEEIDFSNVKIEPLFEELVDFETFAKSDYRAVKITACEAVPQEQEAAEVHAERRHGPPPDHPQRHP